MTGLVSKSDARALWKQERARRADWPSDAVCERIASDPAFHAAKRVGLYAARPGEVDVFPLWRLRPQACVFPKVISPTSMAFHAVDSLSELKPGFAQILEPMGGKRVDQWEPGDWILVPGAAFDEKGARVGSGAGFYDRFLVGVSVRPVGVGWESQIAPTGLAQDPTDVRMWAVFTESRVLKIG